MDIYKQRIKSTISCTIYLWYFCADFSWKKIHNKLNDLCYAHGYWTQLIIYWQANDIHQSLCYECRKVWYEELILLEVSKQIRLFLFIRYKAFMWQFDSITKYGFLSNIIWLERFFLLKIGHTFRKSML